jgi:hypothetical protein
VDGGRIKAQIVELAPKRAARSSPGSGRSCGEPSVRRVDVAVRAVLEASLVPVLGRSRCDNDRTAGAEARNKSHPPRGFMRPSRAHPYGRDSQSCLARGRTSMRTRSPFSLRWPCLGRHEKESTRASRVGRFLWTLPPLPDSGKKGRARNRTSRSPDGRKRDTPVCGRWGFFQVGSRLARRRVRCRHGPRTSPRPRTRSIRPRATARTVMEISRPCYSPLGLG